MYKVELTWLNKNWKEEEKVVGFCTFEPTIGHRFTLSIPLNYRVFETDFGIVKEFQSYKDFHHFLTDEGTYTYRVLEVESDPKLPLNLIDISEYKSGRYPVVLGKTRGRGVSKERMSKLIKAIQDLP